MRLAGFERRLEPLEVGHRDALDPEERAFLGSLNARQLCYLSELSMSGREFGPEEFAQVEAMAGEPGEWPVEHLYAPGGPV